MDLLQHLTSNEKCTENYHLKFKNTSKLAIVFSQFPCLFCALTLGKSLIPHLKSDEGGECRSEFLKYFQIKSGVIEEDLKVIKRKVENIKRKLYESRKRESRRNESQGIVRKEKGVLKFIKSASLGAAIFSCSRCNMSGTRRQFVQAGLVLQCKNCNLGLSTVDPPEPLFEPQFCVVNHCGMISPIEGTEELEDERYSTALLPTSYVEYHQLDMTRSPRSQQNWVQDIYRGVLNYTDVYPRIYEQELKKIQDAKFASILPGFISNLERREVHLYQPQILTSGVPGTDDYHNRNKTNIKHGISQSGALFLLTEICIPNWSNAVYGTQLLLDGKGRVKMDVVVDAATGTHEPTYIVHVGHTPDEECFEGCTMTLGDYLKKVKDAANKVSLSTCANYIAHFNSTFCTTMICDPDSPLGSDIYDANLKFPLETNYTKAVIASWPKMLNDLNIKIAQKQIITKEDLMEYTNYVDAVITTSVSVKYLQENFGLDIEVAKEISSLAQTHQLKDDRESCNQMPSQFTMVKRISNLKNKHQISNLYRSLLSFLEMKIITLDQDDLELDVESWLMNIEEEPGFKIEAIEDEIHLILPPHLCQGQDGPNLIHPPHPEIILPYEKEIKDLEESYGLNIFQAVYHRALTFSVNSSLDIISKSETVLDAFVLPYNPSYLLAARCTATSVFVGGNQQAAAERLKCGLDDNLNFPTGDPLQKYEDSHKQVTLMETIFRHDKHKTYSKSTCTPVFVNTSKERRLKFEKAKTHDRSNQFISRDNVWYQLFEDIYTKYLKKRDSAGKLRLIDFLAWYRKPDQDIEDIEDNADDADDEGPKPIMAVSNDDWDGTKNELPLKIELEDGEVFVRRNRRKVVSFPLARDNEEKLYQDLVLFHYHKTREELENLTVDEIQNLYDDVDIFPELHSSGRPLTKIETVKMRANPAMFDWNEESDLVTEFVKLYFED